MKKPIETIAYTVPQSQNSIEDAIEEALLVAEFFDRTSRDVNACPSQLPPGSPLANYLETAQKHITVPVGVDELSELTVLLNKRR